MVLHTIVSEYDIFRLPPDSNLTCEAWNGRFFECEKGESGLRLRRIISTDPADYLNSQYSLGATFRQPSGGKDNIPSEY